MKSAYPLTCAALLLPQISVIANIQLPAVISDHMVLQQGVSAPIWGWADAGEEVRISVRTESGTGANAPIQTHNAKADSEGKWKISLGKLSVGEPLEIEIQGNNSITIKDILDKLPRRYTLEIYDQKCQEVYQHIYESYSGLGQ